MAKSDFYFFISATSCHIEISEVVVCQTINLQIHNIPADFELKEKFNMEFGGTSKINAYQDEKLCSGFFFFQSFSSKFYSFQHIICFVVIIGIADGYNNHLQTVR